MTAALRRVKAAASVNDLLSRFDAEFVACAYITLLRRPADHEGFLHYLLRLRRNGDKLAVIHALCSSEEGRTKRRSLPGLRSALARHRITQLPLLRQIVALGWSVSRNSAGSEGGAAKPLRAADKSTNDPFDPAWYLKTYPPVAFTGLDPHQHYFSIGKAQGLLPNAAAARRRLIDAQAYLAAYPEVAHTGMDPWEHYVLVGRGEGRTAGVSLNVLQFDREWYVKRNPDVAHAGVDAFQHFTDEGLLHDRDSSSFKDLRSIVPEARVYTDPLPTPPVKVIAFWGRGFPEWSQVARARPYHAEHDQPRLAGELGCYGPRSPGLMKRQAELARSHGVHGFCFHVDGSGGRGAQERPLDLFLYDRSIDIGCCLCWTNEHADSRPHGLGQEVPTPQRCNAEDDAAVIEELSQCFADPRYIRVEGKPLLIIDQPEHLADMPVTVAHWRDWCRTHGVGEIHLCSKRTFDSPPPVASTGIDATIEFPPATSTIETITPAVPGRDPAFRGRIHSYLIAAKAASGYVRGAKLEYRGVMPGWDNTAMQMDRGISFYGATPELYAEWLGHALQETLRTLPAAHRLVFVNAWNEWGEGAYLEPDGRFGHAYLNRTREALAAFAPAVLNDADLRAKTGRTARVAVVVHLHYDNLFEAVAGYLDNIPGACDLYCSVRDGSFLRVQQLIHARFPRATVVSYPNRGRDVLPFLHILAHIRGFGYDAVCKIHAKKSSQRDDGDRWRDDLLAKLLGSRARVTDIIDTLQGGAGLIAAAGHLLPGATYCGSNERRVAQLSAQMGCPASWTSDFSFPAGTMFWCKPQVLAPLLDLSLGPDDFEPEAGQVDGTTAHAIERLVGLSARRSGLTIATTADTLEGDTTLYSFATAPGRHA